MAQIIIIEDENILCKVLVEILKRRGHQAESFQTGAEGCAAMRQHPYDVALVDNRLPDVDGVELVQSLHDEFPETRIILMSGGSETMDDESCSQVKVEGVDEVLHKPFLVEKLINTIANVLGGTSTPGHLTKVKAL